MPRNFRVAFSRKEKFEKGVGKDLEIVRFRSPPRSPLGFLNVRVGRVEY